MTDQTAASITVARKACLTVLTDEQWVLVEPLLPAAKPEAAARCQLARVVELHSGLELQWLSVGFVASKVAANVHRLSALRRVA